MIKENLVFLKETINHFQHTGAVCSTSKWAAKAMTNPMRKSRKPARILELGPGTGSVTVKILEEMIEGDELVICEINPNFMSALKERLSDNPHFQKHKSRIQFFQCPAQDLPAGTPYDFIVCSLPFLNFDKKTVTEIFAKLKEVSHRDSLMTYYQYIGLRQLSKIVAAPDRKKRMNDLDSFFDQISEQNIKRRQRVWLNLLPINIYTLTKIPEIDLH
jgi:phosphatidylethanolamine/phosphatidyl-N-methylethanolamine N-methyltransferase